jgi:hypothetical protein
MQYEGPIVIGGIGGSGTRVVAQIVNELNFYLGNDLNEPLDNLSYTLLFKRRNWFYKNCLNKKEIFHGLSILRKSMTQSSPVFSFNDYLFLLNSTFSMFRNGHNVAGDGKGKWAIDRFKKIIAGSEIGKKDYTGWGWKEPNSHLILPCLQEYFPNLKYIHTIRNGLDMAFSSNQQQLFNWSKLYGIEIPDHKEKIPETSFRYWLAANKRVIEYSNNWLFERFLYLDFDNLCKNPDVEIERIIKFLNISTNDSQFNRLIKIPSIPLTVNRHQEKDISWFSKYKDEYNIIINYNRR